MESIASTPRTGNPASNPLIPIHPAMLAGIQVNSVNARDLHQFLEVGKDFSNWIKAQIDRARLAEHRDFEKVAQKGELSSTGQIRIDYYLSIDAAKHVGMMAGTDKGFEVRDYFIECERRVLTIPPPANPAKLSRLQLIQLAMDAESERLTLACENEVLKPKAAFHDQVHASDDTVTISEFAKANGTGMTRMFRWLRKAGFIIPTNNLPYQKYIDQGFFRVIEEAFQDKHGRDRLFMKTLVTGKGQIVLAKRFRAQGEALRLPGLSN